MQKKEFLRVWVLKDRNWSEILSYKENGNRSI